MIITHGYFLDEFNKFREIMCSPDYTPEQKMDAFHGLLSVYMGCEITTEENEKLREQAMGMLQVELPIRMGLEATQELQDLLDGKYAD